MTSRSAPDLAAILRGEWTELHVAIVLPGVRESVGVKVRRWSTPLSLRFTVQPFTGAEMGAETQLSYEAANAGVQEILKQHQAGIKEGIAIESVLEQFRTAVGGKPSVGILSVKATGAGGTVSSAVATRERLGAVCEAVASLAELDKTSRDPGTPPEKVEALLRSEWTELRVGVEVFPGCVGPSENGVIIKKTASALQVQAFRSEPGNSMKLLKPEEFPLTDWEKIEGEVLKLYGIAFRQYASEEESVGLDVAQQLRVAAGTVGFAIGGEEYISMFVRVITKTGPVTLSNFMDSGDVSTWLAQFGKNGEQSGAR